MWNWLIHTPAGLLTRIAVGLLIFTLFAIFDLHKHKQSATRWREYRFLLFTVAVSILYGILNDQLTSRISWEYFYYGKGLDEILGPQLPPDPAALSLQAAKIGAQATWTAGLLLGVILLLANNPRRTTPRLPYSSLVRALLLILAITVSCGAILGLAGYNNLFLPFSEEFRAMVQHDEFRPRRFMAVYGIHLGGYIGGAVGVIAAVIQITRARSKLARAAISTKSELVQ
jgi:hypothetical protein